MRDTKHEVINFWFVETEPQLWFQKNETFDARIRDRFLLTYEMARDGLCNAWAQDAQGSLALCILLDQFPRNMFRDDPRAFATDDKALLFAKQAINKGFDQVLAPEQRRFVYMPFMHSEKLSEQKRSVELFKTMIEEEPLSYEYALKHLKVIEDFDRFPHRNKALGRETTPEEQVYLDQGGGF